MSHALKMLAGCVLPFLLIFLLPLLGISEGAALLVAMILMFGCHLFMMHGHKMPHDHHEQASDNGERREHS